MNDRQKYLERQARYNRSAKGRERDARWRRENPDKVHARNARRLIVCGMYLGMIGFTEREIAAMLSEEKP